MAVNASASRENCRMALRLSDLQSVRPAFNLFTMLTETAGAGDLKTPGGTAAYRGYSALRFGSPEKAQRAASGKNT
ncbi:hypothetical protein YA24_07545 [Klebsiella aerogenes]|nr:hypothetical protein YA24_07545 [Klebsiella aerogenes]